MKKILTKILCGIMIMSIVTSISVIPAMAEENIKVVLNGTELVFDVPPQIINDRTMVPLRVIFEALGAEVDWIDDENVIVEKVNYTDNFIKQQGTPNPQIFVFDWVAERPLVSATIEPFVVTFQIGSCAMITTSIYNTSWVQLDVPPQIIDNRTLVPVRAISEAFGADVDWNGETQTVTITKDENADDTSTSTATSKVVDKSPEGKYNYYELSDNDMKKLKDSYNDLLQSFEKGSLPNLKNNSDIVKEIKARSDVAVKLVEDAWNKVVTTKIIDLQINSNDEYIFDGEPDLIQENYMVLVKKAGLEANDCLEVSFMPLGDGSVTMFLDFKKPDTHVVIPIIAGVNNTIEILQSKEMKEFSIIN